MLEESNSDEITNPLACHILGGGRARARPGVDTVRGEGGGRKKSSSGGGKSLLWDAAVRNKPETF